MLTHPLIWVCLLFPSNLIKCPGFKWLKTWLKNKTKETSCFALHCLTEVQHREKCTNPKWTAQWIFTNWTNLCHQHPLKKENMTSTAVAERGVPSRLVTPSLLRGSQPPWFLSSCFGTSETWNPTVHAPMFDFSHSTSWVSSTTLNVICSLSQLPSNGSQTSESTEGLVNLQADGLPPRVCD